MTGGATCVSKQIVLTKCAELRICFFQIRPQEMSENCFWVRADEDQYAKPELLSRVALTFGSQRAGQTFLYVYICIYYYI